MLESSSSTKKHFMLHSREKKGKKRNCENDAGKQREKASKWELQNPQGFVVTVKALQIYQQSFQLKLCVIIEFNLRKAAENIHKKYHPITKHI